MEEKMFIQDKNDDIRVVRSSEHKPGDKIPLAPGERVVFRTFDSGATRDLDDDKINPEAALSPLVIERYCEYMREKRLMADGSKRSCDNWQKGIPKESFMESLWRHFLVIWKAHRGWTELTEETLCAILFNAMGYLHRLLEAKIELRKPVPRYLGGPRCGQRIRFDTDRADPPLDR